MAATPLLLHEEEDAMWDRLEERSSPRSFDATIDDIVAEHSNPIEYISRQGVTKVQEFRVDEELVLSRIEDDSIVTMGANTPFLDYSQAWKKELKTEPYSSMDGRRRVGYSRRRRGATLKTPGMQVLAYVLAIKYPCERDGLLHRVVTLWMENGCSFKTFALPAVQGVIDYKWTRFARRLLLFEMFLYLLWLVSFYSFTIAFQDEDVSLSLREVLQTAAGKIAVCSNIGATVGMIPFLIIERESLISYGVRRWLSAWNLLDTTTYCIQIYIIVCHTCRLQLQSGGISMAAAVLAILLLFRLQYFSRVFPNTRFSFVDDLKAVLSDVRYYILFLIIIITGYAVSFHVLFRDPEDQKAHDEFSSLSKAFVQVVAWSFDGPELAELYKDTKNPIMACILGVSFAFIMGMVLINLLISLMTNSLDSVTAHENLRSLLNRAIVIDELERTIPMWVYRRLDCNPTYLHVLRVDPDKLDTATRDALWPMRIGEELSSADAQSPSTIHDETLREIQNELQELRRLLMERLPASS
ncbi:Transient receptor potential cation channel subfamily V member 3 [Picochlorum sp. SENEW3]|nr:Transient receptor potential cation channel subfamily V member 3 [Picochlorum sp. SENEW3]